MRTTNKEAVKKANSFRKSIINDLLTLVKPPKKMSDDDITKRTDQTMNALSKVIATPSEFGFSNQDLNTAINGFTLRNGLHINGLRDSITFNKEKIAELKAEDQDLINRCGSLLQGLSAQARDNHRVMREHRYLLHQIRNREAFINRALGAIEVIQNEIDDRANRQEEIRAQLEKAYQEHKEQLMKFAPKPKKSVKVTPKPRNERVLKGFGELVSEKRKQGIFITEEPLKKANVMDIISPDQLKTGLEQAKKNDGVIHTFDDGRQIITKKAGAVTRYFLRA